MCRRWKSTVKAATSRSDILLDPKKTTGAWDREGKVVGSQKKAKAKELLKRIPTGKSILQEYEDRADREMYIDESMEEPKDWFSGKKVTNRRKEFATKFLSNSFATPVLIPLRVDFRDMGHRRVVNIRTKSSTPFILYDCYLYLVFTFFFT